MSASELIIKSIFKAMIYTHTSGFITLTSSYCYQMLTGMLCLSTSMDCFQAILSLMYIHPPKKTNMAIVKNNQLKMYLPSINDDLSGFVHFHVSFTGTYTSQPAATFPLRVPNVPSVPRHRQAGKIQSSKIIHLEVSIFHSRERAGNSEGDGFLLNPCNFS